MKPLNVAGGFFVGVVLGMSAFALKLIHESLTNSELDD